MDAALLAVMALKRCFLEEPKEEEEFGRRGGSKPCRLAPPPHILYGRYWRIGYK
jgi:hypothetical protein